MQQMNEQKREQVQEQKKEKKATDFVIQKENGDGKATEAMLRTPRTRKYVKALKQVDLPSLEDEKVLERLRQEAIRNGEVTEEEAEELVFNSVEMEVFRKKIEENVSVIIEKELQKERWRKEDLILSPCNLDGCKIHSLNSRGTVEKHFTDAEYKKMSGYQKLAADIVLKHSQWSYVEMREGVIKHFSEAGDVIRVYSYEKD